MTWETLYERTLVYDFDGTQPLHYTIEKKEPMLLDIMLKGKPDLHVPNKLGDSAIHIAVKVCPPIINDLIDCDRTVVTDTDSVCVPALRISLGFFFFLLFTYNFYILFIGLFPRSSFS